MKIFSHTITSWSPFSIHPFIHRQRDSFKRGFIGLRLLRQAPGERTTLDHNNQGKMTIPKLCRRHWQSMPFYSYKASRGSGHYAHAPQVRSADPLLILSTAPAYHDDQVHGAN